MNNQPINITSAEQANKLDIQNRFNTLSGLSTQMSADDPNQLRIQRQMSNLQLTGATPTVQSLAISPESLQPVTLSKLPQVGVPTSAAGLSGKVDSMQQTSSANLLKMETEAQAKLAQTEKTGAWDKIEDLISQKIDVISKKGEVQKEFDVSGKMEAYTKLTNRVNELKFAEMEELKAIENANMTASAKAVAMRDIQRAYSWEKASVGIEQMAALNEWQTAKTLADEQIQIMLEPLDMQLSFIQQYINFNKDDWSTDKKNAFDMKVFEMETERKRTESELKTLSDTKLSLMQSAVSQGAPSSILSAIQNAKTPEEAIQAAGQYAGDMLERQIKQEQLSNARLEGQKLKQELDAGEPLTGEFAGIINSAVGLVPGTKQSIVKKNLASAIASENYTTAYAELANAVSDGLTGTNKTKFDDARTDIGVMTGMRNAIQAFEAAGGDMGLLKGSAEKIARNFGQLATDPKFGALAVQLEREFQSYRNNMTGAAFSPEESREYASVNPAGDKNIDLNLSIIDGALNQLTNRVVSTINARIPEAQKIYDLAFTKADIAESQTPVGDTQYVGNVKYVKAEDGLYYPQNQAPTSGNQTTTQSMRPNYQSLNNTNAFSGLGSFFNFK